MERKQSRYVTKTVRVADAHRNFEMNNIVTYYFVELDKFRKQERDMTVELNQWLSFVDMEKEEWLEMAKAQNAVVRDAITGYEVLTGDAETRRIEEIKFKSMLEEKSALRVAREEGEARGIAKGEKRGERRGIAKGERRGIAKGKARGIVQGRNEGIKLGKIHVAQKLLTLNMPIKQISEITGLSYKEIYQLNSTNNK